MASTVSEGVKKEILKAGSGEMPKKSDNITVHCIGSLVGNPPKKFWSTRDPGQQPFSFQVGIGQVIAGWDEGCLTMKKGEIARFTLAPDKAYGARGFAAWGIPPNAELQFEIELLKINNR